MGQGLAALELLDDEGVAALGQRSLAEVGRDQQGVAVEPVEAVLAFGEGEASGDELARPGVELADDHGVLAALGKADQAVALLGLKAAVALEHPIAALGLGQGVDVEDRLPARVRGAVAVQGGAAPQALGVGLVLPKVVHAAGAERGAGDAVRRGQNGQRLLAEARVAGVGLEHRPGSGVLVADPGQGAGALNLLQPKERVGRLDRFGRKVGQNGRGRRRGRWRLAQVRSFGRSSRGAGGEQGAAKGHGQQERG